MSFIIVSFNIFTVNIEEFPESNDATVDLPTPLPPTMDTNDNCVLNSGVFGNSLNLWRALSTKYASNLVESFERLKLISQIAPVVLVEGSVQSWT